ncbi:hypothetical protein M2202_001383 [Bradyrhizobium japonicum]|jgi:hypothetical protein|nr:hypothetical protein [Bradyrhizobium japonicum]MCP1946366.1 hypothetical protein [Bradyrhizobium japonicum]MCS3543456.1 hypothetical protein [Bradyrhizobium japonicum]MCS3909966.1 hypothetical protein [Bradyrhizobium japonicum]MCS4023912.1 hypothetical protein [Bradyrhizobium japonicum]
MMFLNSISNSNGLAVWTPKAVLNERLVLSRSSVFAFSHSLGQKLPSGSMSRLVGYGPKPKPHLKYSTLKELVETSLGRLC